MESWRFIDSGHSSGYVNMAIDEVLLRSVEDGGAPVLRLYSWSVPTISIGYNQRPTAFALSGVPVVRRLTGGRGVLHDAELTYSVVCPESSPLFSRGINGAYEAVSLAIKDALGRVGISTELSTKELGKVEREKDSCFHSVSRSELMIDGRKIVGSAQRRFKGALLQHGSIMFSVDTGLFKSIFSGVDPLGKGAMATIEEFSDISVEELKASLHDSFESCLGVNFTSSKLGETELAVKSVLVREKYSTTEWNFNACRDDSETNATVLV